MITKLKYEVQEKQIHVRLFMGPETNQLIMCGSLMFQPAQFELFRRLLQDGSLLTVRQRRLPGRAILTCRPLPDDLSSL